MTDAFATALESLRSCVCTALSEAGRPVCSCCLGMLSADNCCACSDGSGNGIVTIRPVSIGPSRNFPTILPADPDMQKGCGPNYLVLQAAIEIQRCVPTVAESGAMPDYAALTTQATDWLEDAAVIRRAAGCCLRTLVNAHTISRFSVGVTAPIDPLGGCGGSGLIVWLATGYCVCPD